MLDSQGSSGEDNEQRKITEGSSSGDLRIGSIAVHFGSFLIKQWCTKLALAGSLPLRGKVLLSPCK